MDDLENDFFCIEQDDIFANVISGVDSEHVPVSLNCSVLETSHNKCSDKLEESSSECAKVERTFVENLEEKSFLNHRFSMRFTPKAVKRKFAGPAGLILDEGSDDLLNCNVTPVSKKLLADEIDYQNISSSQSSIEELLQSSSWKKLQDDVSSNLSFLSVVKHFSIQGVLSDTSKKKLPKHIIVPILCVYIKEFNDPLCICMDDTGEINGKIDKEVLQLYGNFIKCGTSLVLKQVTSLCNVLLLQKTNVISFYLDDGSVHHIQDWDAMTEKESSVSLNCTHPITPKLIQKSHSETVKKTSVAKPKLCKLLSSENKYSALNIVSRDFTETMRQNNLVKKSPINQDFEADMIDDDFDELLGNLDEKSFLEEF